MADPIMVGQGPHRIIALHGWFGSGSAWKHFADVVDARRFTYVFPDYRGYGARALEPGKFTIDEIASDVLALADWIGWDSFNLVGHSMGGKAIQRVLAMAPERVKAMVGISPVPADRVPFDEQSWAFFSSAWSDRSVREAIIDNTTGGRLSKAWVAKMAGQPLMWSRPEAFAAYLESWAKEDFASEIEGLTVPFRVIVGRHDPAITADLMKATTLSSYPNASLEILDGAGHYAMDELPVALATSIETFIGTEG